MCRFRIRMSYMSGGRVSRRMVTWAPVECPCLLAACLNFLWKTQARFMLSRRVQTKMSPGWGCNHVLPNNSRADRTDWGDRSRRTVRRTNGAVWSDGSHWANRLNRRHRGDGADRRGGHWGDGIDGTYRQRWGHRPNRADWRDSCCRGNWADWRWRRWGNWTNRSNGHHRSHRGRWRGRTVWSPRDCG